MLQCVYLSSRGLSLVIWSLSVSMTIYVLPVVVVVLVRSWSLSEVYSGCSEPLGVSNYVSAEVGGGHVSI